MEAQINKTVTSLEQSNANEFLKVANHFKLGNLPTESPNIKTMHLSHEAKHNIAQAILTIKNVDSDVFKILDDKLDELSFLHQRIKTTIDSGGNIYLCGCGATGRLSLALEAIWRVHHKNNPVLKERVISFMAGGDVALIHSVEKFEDFPEFGERQLRELGFKQGDLLISTTEGGETPFVIGATEAASLISTNEPFFLYCNPDDILILSAERSKKVISNPKIHKINLTVGPMALTGSTRMQATTILMYGVGLAMWYFDQSFDAARIELAKFTNIFNSTDFSFLKPFIERESDIYQQGEYLLYETDSALGISILTDTTERSPTFSLYPFENQLDQNKIPSLSYLFINETNNNEEAWNNLLGRPPRAFHWKEVTSQTSRERLMGFNISAEFPRLRENYHHIIHHNFKITFNHHANKLTFELDEIKHDFILEDMNFLSTHLLLKILLNNLSTVIMGRMGRYEDNLMTWVRASNNKLIDRAVRYADKLLQKKGITISYDELVKKCFELKDVTPRDQALVLKIVEAFS